MLCALWMTVYAFSPRTWLLANKNTPLPEGAIPQSICEEGAAGDGRVPGMRVGHRL